MATRTQIYLEDDQMRRLRLKAERMHVSVSELVRRGVDLVLDEQQPSGDDPLLRMLGGIAGKKDDSVSVDRVLYGKK